MENIQHIFPGKKTLLITSGIACVSVGAYVVYTIFKNKKCPEQKLTPTTPCNRQPSENLDLTDYDEEQISGLSRRVLVLGLEKSGKSCLLAALSNKEEPQIYTPTQGFNAVCIGTHIGPRLDIMEVGGSTKYKEYWGSCIKGINVLMYVIDSSDKESLSNSLDALLMILQMKELEDIPVVIVFSKRDNENALPLESMIIHFEAKRFENKSFQYSSVQVKSGGAPTTEGVEELQETIQNLK